MDSRITTAVTFITSEGSNLHDGIGGSSHFDDELVQFVPFRPYLQLAEALKIYIPRNLHSDLEDDSHDAWNRLSERILQTETGYTESKAGFWRKIWYNIGEAEEISNAWVALIPDSYGLAVVKTGLAVVFQLAGKSVSKRQKIFDTFMGLRDALMRASPTERSFRENKVVGDCADQLYQAVVNSIEDMILVTSKDKTSWRNPITKFKRKPPPPDPDEILQKVTESTDKFERALGNARDQTIEATNRVGQYNAIMATNIHRDLTRYGENIDNFGTEIQGQYTQVATNMKLLTMEATHVRKGIDDNGAFLRQESEKNEIWRTEFQDSIEDKILGALQRMNGIAARENAMQDDQLNSRNELLGILLAQMKKRDTEIAILKQKVDRIQERRAIIRVDLNQFGQILAQSNSSSREPVDLNKMFQHPNDDFELALMQKSRFTTATQGQVQSLLQDTQFLNWMSNPESDVIVVDANLNSSDPGFSAISVFSATLIAGMVKVHPTDVVIHFFCSAHTSYRDAWHGPNGLVRSLIVQLLMRLVEMKILNLDFIDDEDFLLALDEHDLVSLCETLFCLVSQLPQTITVYCIIDSISAFDNSLAFKELGIVLDWIQRILEDENLDPILKVLITNPTSSTRRMKELLMIRGYPSRLVNLSPSNLDPMVISNHSIENQILRQSTPSPSMGPSMGERNQATSRSRNRAYLDGY